MAGKLKIVCVTNSQDDISDRNPYHGLTVLHVLSTYLFSHSHKAVLLSLATMDKIDPVRALLSVIAEAVRVCQKNRSVPREWMVEAEFCSRLRATLGSVKDCSPIKGNFPHAQDLNHLIQVVLQTLGYFYNELTPGLSNLQKGCAPGASPALLSQLEGQLGGSVIPRTKALREQVNRYLQAIDTLLLLYVMYGSLGGPSLDKR